MTAEELNKEAEELDAEIFLLEETILLSPLSKEDERKVRSKLTDTRLQLANIRAYLYQQYQP